MVNDLIYVTPEEEGLSSKNVVKFIRRLREMRINIHSFMLVRNGRIMTEAYYKPFTKTLCIDCIRAVKRTFLLR